MTDIEVLAAMLDRAGVVYSRKPPSEGSASAAFLPPGGEILRIEQGAGPKNDGYYLFLTEITFDVDGNLVLWAAWE